MTTTTKSRYVFVSLDYNMAVIDVPAMDYRFHIDLDITDFYDWLQNEGQLEISWSTGYAQHERHYTLPISYRDWLEQYQPHPEKYLMDWLEKKGDGVYDQVFDRYLDREIISEL